MRLPKIELPDREPTTFTPDELRRLLKYVSDRALPSILLSAFAGLRPQETLKIKWENVDWEDGSLIVPGAKKTGNRQTDLLPNLRAWLALLRGEASERIVDLGRSGLTQACARAVKRANKELEQFGAKQRLKWSVDVLRHSYGSYRWAIIRDAPKVVAEMGTSAQVFKRHYHRQLPRAQGAAWFEIMPDGMRGKVVQMDFPRFSTPLQRHTH